MPPARPDSPRFLMLDFLRGVAAIAVLLYHTEHAGYLGVQLLPSAYLAVDLFFLLSGFVIAHNYDRKIAAGMSFTDFMVQRLIRLYPCLLLALALGLLIFCLRMVRYEGFLDTWRIVAATGLNALFLPAVIQPYGTSGYFPFNGAAWSLTFELIANIVYWVSFRQLNGLRILLVVIASAVLLAIGASMIGTLDIGMRPSDFWWGIPRVALTFFIGVALRRHAYERMPVDLGSKAAPLAMACLVLAFSLHRMIDSEQALVAAGMVVLLVVFPVLLLAVAGATPGRVTATLCTWTGDASYPVYLLQTPLMGVVAALSQLITGARASEFAPWMGIAFVIGTILVSLWVDRRFELPLRKRLKARWLRRRSQPA
jgi:peptidoglycan/LPS O-acetylase OafA/YrhL